jgi:hypothetical protein
MGYDMYQEVPDQGAEEEHLALRQRVKDAWAPVYLAIQARGLSLENGFLSRGLPGDPKKFDLVAHHKVLKPNSSVTMGSMTKVDIDPESEDSWYQVRVIVPREQQPELYQLVDAARKETDDTFESDLSDPAYFRLNIWGMSRYREAMYDLGLLDEDTLTPDIDWPEYTITDTDSDTEREAKEDAYDNALRDALSFTTESGLPSAMKFSDNSGWVVLPSECEAFVNKYDNLNPADISASLDDNGITDTRYWAEWINFIRRSIETQGFRVY